MPSLSLALPSVKRERLMLDVSFSISPDDLVSRRRSDPARSTKLIFPWRMCPKSGSCTQRDQSQHDAARACKLVCRSAFEGSLL